MGIIEDTPVGPLMEFGEPLWTLQIYHRVDGWGWNLLSKIMEE